MTFQTELSVMIFIKVIDFFISLNFPNGDILPQDKRKAEVLPNRDFITATVDRFFKSLP